LFYFCLLNFSLADDCKFTSPVFRQGPRDVGVVISPPSRVLSCFTSIPFETKIRNDTIKQLKTLSQLYSFKDISRDSRAPYRIRLNLERELNLIQAVNFSSDWQFHEHLNTIFNRLGDAHTLYYAPKSYRNFIVLRPFYLDSRLDSESNKQHIYVRRTIKLFGTIPFKNLTGVDVERFSGMQIVSIDGKPAVNWVRDLGNFAGISRSESVRFNNALLNLIPLSILGATGPFPSSDTETYVFEDGTNISIPVVVIATRLYNSTQEFRRDLIFSRSQFEQQRMMMHRRDQSLRFFNEGGTRQNPIQFIRQKHEHLLGKDSSPESLQPNNISKFLISFLFFFKFFK
jgi:hypothetical protein